MSADVDTGETEDKGGRSVCNKGQERKEMGVGGEFKKRIITLKKCALSHTNRKECFIFKDLKVSARHSL